MPSADLRDLIRSASDQRLLCIGDVMLDAYIYGEATRLSPEAPVPVLSRQDTTYMPGGAANTARNVAALGARTRLIGLRGNDETGERLQDSLQALDLIDAHLLMDPDRATTRKTRLVARGQHLLRLDEDTQGVISDSCEAELIAAIEEAADGATAILLSDYDKGTITPDVINAVLRAGARYTVPVIIDPKGKDITRYGPADLLKPNAQELSDMLQMPTNTDAEIEAALNLAMDASPVRAIVVTRAAQGLSFLERGKSVGHMHATVRDVYDVSGAGDTCLASLGVALSAGADLRSAADFALTASSIVVGKVGTAVASAQELLEHQQGAVIEQGDLLSLLNVWRGDGQKIGFTNGCFDILHSGHLHLLEAAKARCDRLIVGLNSDASVRRLKGDARPINDEVSRARLLGGLGVVDAVILFGDDTPLKLVKAIGPDLLVKGGDYTKETIVGASEVIQSGGEVFIVPLLEGHSTTKMIRKASE